MSLLQDKKRESQQRREKNLRHKKLRKTIPSKTVVKDGKTVQDYINEGYSVEYSTSGIPSRIYKKGQYDVKIGYSDDYKDEYIKHEIKFKPTGYIDYEKIQDVYRDYDYWDTKGNQRIINKIYTKEINQYDDSGWLKDKTTWIKSPMAYEKTSKYRKAKENVYIDSKTKFDKEYATNREEHRYGWSSRSFKPTSHKKDVYSYTYGTKKTKDYHLGDYKVINKDGSSYWLSQGPPKKIYTESKTPASVQIGNKRIAISDNEMTNGKLNQKGIDRLKKQGYLTTPKPFDPKMMKYHERTRQDFLNKYPNAKVKHDDSGMSIGIITKYEEKPKTKFNIQHDEHLVPQNYNTYGQTQPKSEKIKYPEIKNTTIPYNFKDDKLTKTNDLYNKNEYNSFIKQHKEYTKGKEIETAKQYMRDNKAPENVIKASFSDNPIDQFMAGLYMASHDNIKFVAEDLPKGGKYLWKKGLPKASNWIINDKNKFEDIKNAISIGAISKGGDIVNNVVGDITKRTSWNIRNRPLYSSSYVGSDIITGKGISKSIDKLKATKNSDMISITDTSRIINKATGETIDYNKAYGIFKRGRKTYAMGLTSRETWLPDGHGLRSSIKDGTAVMMEVKMKGQKLNVKKAFKIDLNDVSDIIKKEGKTIKVIDSEAMIKKLKLIEKIEKKPIILRGNESPNELRKITKGQSDKLIKANINKYHKLLKKKASVKQTSKHLPDLYPEEYAKQAPKFIKGDENFLNYWKKKQQVAGYYDRAYNELVLPKFNKLKKVMPGVKSSKIRELRKELPGIEKHELVHWKDMSFNDPPQRFKDIEKSMNQKGYKHGLFDKNNKLVNPNSNINTVFDSNNKVGFLNKRGHFISDRMAIGQYMIDKQGYVSMNDYIRMMKTIRDKNLPIDLRNFFKSTIYKDKPHNWGTELNAYLMDSYRNHKQEFIKNFPEIAKKLENTNARYIDPTKRKDIIKKVYEPKIKPKKVTTKTHIEQGKPQTGRSITNIESRHPKDITGKTNKDRIVAEYKSYVKKNIKDNKPYLSDKGKQFSQKISEMDYQNVKVENWLSSNLGWKTDSYKKIKDLSDELSLRRKLYAFEKSDVNKLFLSEDFEKKIKTMIKTHHNKRPIYDKLKKLAKDKKAFKKTMNNMDRRTKLTLVNDYEKHIKSPRSINDLADSIMSKISRKNAITPIEGATLGKIIRGSNIDSKALGNIRKNIINSNIKNSIKKGIINNIDNKLITPMKLKPVTKTPIKTIVKTPSKVKTPTKEITKTPTITKTLTPLKQTPTTPIVGFNYPVDIPYKSSKKLMKEMDLMEAYIPILFDNQGKKKLGKPVRTEKDAINEGMDLTDKTPFNKFKVNKFLVKKKRLFRVKNYRNKHKFFRTKHSYHERKPFRFDHKNEHGGILNKLKGTFR